MQALGNRVDYGGANAAADAQRAAAGDEFSRFAQWSSDALDGLTRFEGDQVARALSNGLDDKSDGSRNRIGIGDGQRDPLSIFREVNDDELAGLPDLGNARRPDVQTGDVRAKARLGEDLMHERYGQRVSR